MARYFRREEIADIFRLRSAKRIFVGYGQLNFTTIFYIFLHQACLTYSYLDMQHLGAGHIFFRSGSSF